MQRSNTVCSPNAKKQHRDKEATQRQMQRSNTETKTQTPTDTDRQTSRQTGVVFNPMDRILKKQRLNKQLVALGVFLLVLVVVWVVLGGGVFAPVPAVALPLLLPSTCSKNTPRDDPNHPQDQQNPPRATNCVLISCLFNLFSVRLFVIL